MARALEQLVATCRTLGGANLAAARSPLPSRLDVQALPSDARSEAGPALHALAQFLRHLADSVEPELIAELTDAGHHWDSVDAASILDDETRARAARVIAQWREVGGPEAALAVLTVHAAIDLVALVERRLASLIRLRQRSEPSEILPGGRPFLDLPAALREAARRWS